MVIDNPAQRIRDRKKLKKYFACQYNRPLSQLAWRNGVLHSLEMNWDTSQKEWRLIRDNHLPAVEKPRQEPKPPPEEQVPIRHARKSTRPIFTPRPREDDFPPRRSWDW